MLQFDPIARYAPGLLSQMLFESYADLLNSGGESWMDEISKWEEFDRQVFENPDTIGNCVFVSSHQNQTIGFASYNPRSKPDYARIGHNCVLPSYQKRGFGKLQVCEILRRFQMMGIGKAVVRTSEHPFFTPARRMYLSSGFTKTGTAVGGPDPRYKIVTYEKTVNP